MESLYEFYKAMIDKLYDEQLSPYADKESYYEKIKVLCDETEASLQGLEPYQQIRILAKSLISRVFKVYSRYQLVEDLEQSKNAHASTLLRVTLYPGLITYLLLTCFDQLGQPVTGWLFFPNWLKKKAEDVKRMLSDFKNLNILHGDPDSRDIAQIDYIYGRYHSEYGVKYSFYRFINEVLPANTVRQLLDSIQIIEYDNQRSVTAPDKSDAEKLKWMYATRNAYTHNLHSVETNMTHGRWGQRGNIYLRERKLSNNKITEVWVHEDFNEIIKLSLLSGILTLIGLPGDIQPSTIVD
jgi:hypothetical protein